MVNNNNPVGECAEGYTGYVCAECEFGWSKTSSFGSNAFKCGRCPNPIVNVIQLIIIGCLFCVVMVFMVRSTINGAS